jgi:hypothetical protein
MCTQSNGLLFIHQTPHILNKNLMIETLMFSHWLVYPNTYNSNEQVQFDS